MEDIQDTVTISGYLEDICDFVNTVLVLRSHLFIYYYNAHRQWSRANFHL